MIKSPAPSALDGLFDLACRDGVDIRPTLLRVLTDLYVQKPSHSAEEETQYTELALGLIDTADAPTRVAVSARLATYRAAPPAVLQRLGLPIPARRTPAAFAPPAPAMPPVTAPQPRSNDLTDQFFAATPEERRLILITLDLAAGPAAPRLPTPSRDITAGLEQAALRRNTAEFVRILQGALGIGRALADRIVQDASGEAIVVAAKAVGMSAPSLQRVLLFLNPAIGQSVRRVYDLAKLFDEMKPAAAAQMLSIWRKDRPAAPPRHQPQLWDDEKRSARQATTPSHQRGTRDGGALPARLRGTAG